MSGVQDESILQYAHRMGLCEDYKHGNPLAPDRLPTPPPEVIEEADAFRLLPELHLVEVEPNQEQLTISVGAARLLQSISSPYAYQDDFVEEIRLARTFRVEEPLLSSDPELDERMMAAKFSHAIDLHEEAGKALPFDAMPDIDPSFSLLESSHLIDVDKSVTSEALEIPKDAIRFLRSILQGAPKHVEDVFRPYKPGAYGEPVTCPLSNGVSNKDERLSPPLLPSSPKLCPHSPASDTFQLDFTSTPNDPTAEELAALDEDIFNASDGGNVPSRTDHRNGAQPYDHIIGSSPCYEPELSTPKRPCPKDLRVEAPLMPWSDDSRPSKRTKTTQHMASAAGDLPLEASSPLKGREGSSDSMDYAGVFEQFMDPASMAVDGALHEQLEMSDAMVRIPVPTIEDQISEAPWDAWDKSCNLLGQLVSTHLIDEKPWPDTSRYRSLVWVPVPSPACDAIVTEQLGNEYDEDYLAKVYEYGDVESLTWTWKPEGPRLIDEEDDELAPAEGPLGEASISTLVRELQVPINQQGHADQTRQQSLLQDGHSAHELLRNFIQTRTGVVQDAPAMPKTKEMQSAGTEQSRAQDARQQAKRPAARVFARPEVSHSTKCCTFIVSSTLLVQRNFIQELSRRLPAAELIERGFAAADTATLTNKKAKGEKFNMEEADMILSPGTGLVITTLQKIKQKPLPGQSAVSQSLHERLWRLSARYERLIILIAEGASSAIESRALDTKDCIAYNELVAYCSRLDGTFQVRYIPGGLVELVEWTVSTMLERNSGSEGMCLRQEETEWEVFLRRAGLDAFAAQAVLGELCPERTRSRRADAAGGTNASVNSRQALPGFFNMSEQQRIEVFGRMMGGSRILTRVSKAMDGRWSERIEGERHGRQRRD